MKKFTLAAAAMVALAAQAQSPYQVNPSTSEVLKQSIAEVKYITLSDGAVAEFTKAGAVCDYIGPDAAAGRNLWYWENTFVPSDESYPRVDEEEGGYISVEVGNVGWSGAGLAVSNTNALDLSSFNDNTHFHLAYFTPTDNAPESIALILLNETAINSQPAKISLGGIYVDGGVGIPSVGEAANDDWQGIDLTFAQLKKLWPAFSPASLNAWYGNLLSFLGGAVPGKTFAFDAVYFYNTKEGGVETVAADFVAEFTVTANTVNVMGSTGIELYNLAGQLVKSTAGTTLGLTSLQPGVYVAKSGNKVQKIVVR